MPYLDGGLRLWREKEREQHVVVSTRDSIGIHDDRSPLLGTTRELPRVRAEARTKENNRQQKEEQ
jgi:hypothetical protein